MRALARVSTVVATAAALAAIGGGVASADWFVTSSRSTATVRTLRMPGFERGPAIEWHPETKSVTVRWVSRQVQRYIVERYNTATGAGTTVCAVVTAGCRDDDVPGGTWAYTIRAVNWRWTGPESPRSTALTIRLPGATRTRPEASATTVGATPEPSASAGVSKVEPRPSESSSPTAGAGSSAPGEPAPGDG